MYELSARSKNNLAGVNPLLIDIIKEAIIDSPFDFGIPNEGGKRTADEQNDLYRKGKSKCDGYNKKSYHQSGNAFDIYAYVDGKASWKMDHLVPIANHILQIAKECFDINLRWGGDWDQDGTPVWEDEDENFVDAVHFELR
jgi:peptidoglycan L-alanyl-D-glutamate endopeptidase CwlK